MDIFKKLKLSAAEQRLREEALYQEALREVELGLRRDGLWAKAVANANGDASLAKSLYLKYRVQSMLDEALILSELSDARPASNVQAQEHTAEVPSELEDDVGERWVCGKCGERHEMQFEECWRCGAERQASASD